MLIYQRFNRYLFLILANSLTYLVKILKLLYLTFSNNLYNEVTAYSNIKRHVPLYLIFLIMFWIDVPSLCLINKQIKIKMAKNNKKKQKNNKNKNCLNKQKQLTFVSETAAGAPQEQTGPGAHLRGVHPRRQRIRGDAKQAQRRGTTHQKQTPSRRHDVHPERRGRGPGCGEAQGGSGLLRQSGEVRHGSSPAISQMD